MGQVSENQLIVFELGSEEFGLDIQEVREIINVPEITKIPDTESYILGIIKLREKIIVVLDLEKKLKILPSIESKNKRIIIVELEGESIGMLVDSCNQVLRMNGASIDNTPRAISCKIGANYLRGIAKVHDRLIILLNLSHLFEGEISKIKEMYGTKEEPANTPTATIIPEEKPVQVAPAKPTPVPAALAPQATPVPQPVTASSPPEPVQPLTPEVTPVPQTAAPTPTPETPKTA